MKRKKIAIILSCAVLVMGGIVYAADHMDAPAVKGQTSDITDLYVFESTSNPDNLVFVGNSQGLLAPSTTASAQFDPNVLVQFKIDNTGDNVEDLVIQVIYKNGQILLYGPAKPTLTGTRTKINEANYIGSVAVTPYGAGNPIVANLANGIKLFAGPRDDPFFFDLDQYHKILAGTATSFNNPGTDTFAGTNVLSIVVEVPKSMLNASSGKLNVWLTTSTQETSAGN